jgi:hypothetical protein
VNVRRKNTKTTVLIRSTFVFFVVYNSYAWTRIPIHNAKFILKRGIIWHTATTNWPQCLHLQSETRRSHNSQQDLQLFVDKFPSKWRQITSLSDTETIGRITGGHQGHSPNHLPSKVLPLKYGKIQTVLEHRNTKVYAFYCIFFCSSNLSEQSVALQAMTCNRDSTISIDMAS